MTGESAHDTLRAKRVGYVQWLVSAKVTAPALIAAAPRSPARGSSIGSRKSARFTVAGKRARLSFLRRGSSLEKQWLVRRQPRMARCVLNAP
jgi:hypothetical protein